DAVPFGLFLALAARLVLPGFSRRHAEVDYLLAVLGGPHIRVLAQVAHQNHFVHAASHVSSYVLAAVFFTAFQVSFAAPVSNRAQLGKSSFDSLSPFRNSPISLSRGFRSTLQNSSGTAPGSTFTVSRGLLHPTLKSVTSPGRTTSTSPVSAI